MTVPDDDFDTFFRTRSPALLRAAYLLTGDRHLAEDLVQEALARTHVAWSRLRAEGSPEAYTRRIMYNLQVSRWRRSRFAEVRTDRVPEARHFYDEAGAAVDRLAMRRALGTLPVRQRAAVILRYFEDRSEAETAEILGCRTGTVKSHLSRAIARLRELLPELSDSGVEGASR
jgi:RNA polymerase sigma-70 factor (sigma-E family)